MTDSPRPQDRPVDPATLPDPEDITEADLPEAPPRPETQTEATRRFGGTHRQITGALTFYKITAWLTGIMLLLLVAEMVLKYAFGLELFASGVLMDNTENTLSFQNSDNITGAVNISLLVLIVHGWMYVIYLVACFRLWSLMRWAFPTLLAMAGGGVVPFLSFIVEMKVDKRTRQELAENPEGLRRY